MISIANKTFWVKTMKWPINDLKVQTLSDQDIYNTKRVTLYGRGSMPATVITRSCKANVHRCSYDAMMLRFFNQSFLYPSPKLYYAKVDDAKKESTLIVEDMHPKYKSFSENHVFTVKEEAALLKNLKILNNYKLNKQDFQNTLAFMKDAMRYTLTPVEVLARIGALEEGSIITREQATLLKSISIPYLTSAIRTLEMLPLKISIRNFSPTHIVIDKNDSEVIFVNYNYFALGNSFETYVSISKYIPKDRRDAFLNLYLESINFKNKTQLNLNELVGLIKFAISLNKVLTFEEIQKRAINKNTFDSLLESIKLVKNIF